MFFRFAFFTQLFLVLFSCNGFSSRQDLFDSERTLFSMTGVELANGENIYKKGRIFERTLVIQLPDNKNLNEVKTLNHLHFTFLIAHKEDLPKAPQVIPSSTTCSNLKAISLAFLEGLVHNLTNESVSLKRTKGMSDYYLQFENYKGLLIEENCKGLKAHFNKSLEIVLKKEFLLEKTYEKLKKNNKIFHNFSVEVIDGFLFSTFLYSDENEYKKKTFYERETDNKESGNNSGNTKPKKSKSKSVLINSQKAYSRDYNVHGLPENLYDLMDNNFRWIGIIISDCWALEARKMKDKQKKYTY